MKMEQRKALWEIVDNRHVEFLKAMQGAIEATNDSIKDQTEQSM